MPPVWVVRSVLQGREIQALGAVTQILQPAWETYKINHNIPYCGLQTCILMNNFLCLENHFKKIFNCKILTLTFVNPGLYC